MLCVICRLSCPTQELGADRVIDYRRESVKVRGEGGSSALPAGCRGVPPQPTGSRRYLVEVVEVVEGDRDRSEMDIYGRGLKGAR